MASNSELSMTFSSGKTEIVFSCKTYFTNLLNSVQVLFLGELPLLNMLCMIFINMHAKICIFVI